MDLQEPLILTTHDRAGQFQGDCSSNERNLVLRWKFSPCFFFCLFSSNTWFYDCFKLLFVFRPLSGGGEKVQIGVRTALASGNKLKNETMVGFGNTRLCCVAYGMFFLLLFYFGLFWGVGFLLLICIVSLAMQYGVLSALVVYYKLICDSCASTVT